MTAESFRNDQNTPLQLQRLVALSNPAQPALKPEPIAGKAATHIMHFAVLAIVAFFCHGLLLVSQSTSWDSWYVLAWLKAKNFAPMNEFFGSVGIPLYALLYRPFAYLGNIPAAFMSATFACLLVGSILTYHLILRLTPVNRGEALGIVALAQAVPIFSAAQDFIMFFFIFTYTLFLASAALVVSAMHSHGRRRWWRMGLGIVGFWISFSNAALLVFYGSFYLLLFLRFGRLPGTTFIVAGWNFVRRHPILFLLPPANWMARPFLTPQYGWHASYNSPVANIGDLPQNLWSFFQNVPGFHLRLSIAWAVAHPVFVCVLVLAAVCFWIAAPRRWNFPAAPIATRHLVWTAFLLLFLAIFPFAAAGKHFSAVPVGSESHHLLLAGLPVAILLYAAIRCAICWRHRAHFGRIVTPLVGCAVLFLGGQLSYFYVAEQAEWVFGRSVLHQAAKSKEVRESSVLFLRGFGLVRQPVFGIYAFGMAFDEMTRLIMARPPENEGNYYTPSEIERTLLGTTILPNEFRKINPAGQQTVVSAERNRGDASNWDIVWRYQMLRFFGPEHEMNEYLAGLCTLEARAIRPATPLEVAPSRTAFDGGNHLSVGIPSGSFVNGAGMEMIFLPACWWAGKFEVTQAQYELLMKTNPSLFKDPLRPVECVSWNEASEFCRRLTELEAKAGRLPRNCVYRLPTVEEFTQMSAGSSLNNAVTSAQGIQWHTAPVGSVAPNSLGLHDVVGNVWEWCLDFGDESQRFRVSRGGSWVNYPWELAPYSGVREGLGYYDQVASERLRGPLRRDYPDQGFWDRGFRCVLGPEKMPVVVVESNR